MKASSFGASGAEVSVQVGGSCCFGPLKKKVGMRAAYEDLWLGSRLWDVGELGGFGVWGEGLRCWGFVIS